MRLKDPCGTVKSFHSYRRFFEYGGSNVAVGIVDILAVTKNLPCLQELSLYNVCVWNHDSAALKEISTLLREHKRLQRIDFFSCAPKLVEILNKKCREFGIVLKRKNKSNISGIN